MITIKHGVLLFLFVAGLSVAGLFSQVIFASGIDVENVLFDFDQPTTPASFDITRFAVEQDGDNIVVAGLTGNSAALWRYLPGGEVDNTFGGGDGQTTHALTASTTPVVPTDVIALKNGGYVATGSHREPEQLSATNMVVWKWTEDGELDPEFGDGTCSNGTGVEGKYGCTVYDSEHTVGVTDDDDHGTIVVEHPKSGALYVFGYIDDPSTDDNITVWKFNEDGTYDETFGDESCTDGNGGVQMGCKMFINLGSGTEQSPVLKERVSAVEIKNNRFIVGALGQEHPKSSNVLHTMVFSMDADGELDSNFGDGSCVNGVGEGGAYGCTVLTSTEPDDYETNPQNKLSILISGYTRDANGGQYVTPSGLSVDQRGNIYVTGSVHNLTSGRTDLLVFKMNKKGKLKKQFGDGSCATFLASGSNGCVVYDLGGDEGTEQVQGVVILTDKKGERITVIGDVHYTPSGERTGIVLRMNKKGKVKREYELAKEDAREIVFDGILLEKKELLLVGTQRDSNGEQDTGVLKYIHL